MESKSIKISEENYRWLLGLAAEMQKKYERTITFDDTLNEVKSIAMQKKKSLLDLAGKWKMSEAEAEKFKEGVKRGWEKWKIPSV